MKTKEEALRAVKTLDGIAAQVSANRENHKKIGEATSTIIEFINVTSSSDISDETK